MISYQNIKKKKHPLNLEPRQHLRRSSAQYPHSDEHDEEGCGKDHLLFGVAGLSDRECERNRASKTFKELFSSHQY